jgi:hypothetical protein
MKIKIQRFCFFNNLIEMEYLNNLKWNLFCVSVKLKILNLNQTQKIKFGNLDFLVNYIQSYPLKNRDIETKRLCNFVDDKISDLFDPQKRQIRELVRVVLKQIILVKNLKLGRIIRQDY